MPSTTTQLIFDYHPGFSPSFSPTVCAGPAVSRLTWLLLCKPLRNPASFLRACTRGMGHPGSRMRTPRFRMRISILIGIVLRPSLRSPLPPRLLLLLPSNWHYPQRRPTQTTHHRPLHGPEIEVHSLKDLELTCPRPAPTQLKRGIKHATGEQATIRWNEVTTSAVDLGPPSCSNSHTRIRARAMIQPQQ